MTKYRVAIRMALLAVFAFSLFCLCKTILKTGTIYQSSSRRALPYNRIVAENDSGYEYDKEKAKTAFDCASRALEMYKAELKHNDTLPSIRTGSLLMVNGDDDINYFFTLEISDNRICLDGNPTEDCRDKMDMPLLVSYPEYDFMEEVSNVYFYNAVPSAEQANDIANEAYFKYCAYISASDAVYHLPFGSVIIVELGEKKFYFEFTERGLENEKESVLTDMNYDSVGSFNCPVLDDNVTICVIKK